MNFKNFFLLLTVLFIFSLQGQAQDSVSAHVKSGIRPLFKLGVCYMPQSTFIQNTSEKNDPTASPYRQPGFMTGISAGIVFSKKVSLDFGLLYSKQGVDYSVKTPFYAPITLSYIKVPVVISYRPLMKYNIPVELSGGFQCSALAKAVIDMPQGYYLPGNDKQWFNSATIDLVGAIGFNFEMRSNVYCNLKCRADYSLSDPIKKDYISNDDGSMIMHWKSDRSASHNITVGFLIGLEYHFGKK